MFNPSNKDRKSISVVIPIYNEMNDYFIQLLNTLKNQTLDQSKYQVILVDNNSTDNSNQFIQTYIQKHKLTNFVILFQPQPGVTNARKMGYEYVIQNYSKNHLIVSCDADSIITNQYLETYYNKQLEVRQLHKKFYLGGTPFYNYDQIPTELVKMKELLQYKHKLDEYLISLTGVPKFEGGDSAISVELYNEIPLKPLYYIENKQIHATPSDDWNYCFDVMKHKNLKPLICNTSNVSKINCRKFINNIQDLLKGDLYGQSWEDLNSQNNTVQDLTDSEYIQLKYMITRSSIIHHYYIKEYILKHTYSSKYKNVYKLFGYSKYDDVQNYFGPAVYCYLMYGEKLWNTIPLDIIDIEWKQLEIVEELQKQIVYDYKNVYKQILFKLSKSNEIFDYFLEI